MLSCRVRVWIGALLLLTVGVTFAEAATPADTYQAIEAVNAQLAAFHDANGTMPAVDPQAPTLTERLPRHVLQKAREVLLKIQAVRQLNGLPLFTVEDFAKPDPKMVRRYVISQSEHAIVTGWYVLPGQGAWTLIAIPKARTPGWCWRARPIT